MREIIYIKAESYKLLNKTKVYLSDILAMECSDENKVKRLESIKVLEIGELKEARYVVSILKVIELIHRCYPDIEVRNLSATDIIIGFEKPSRKRKPIQWMLVVLVSLITFCGAAFSTMAFINDGAIATVLQKVYEALTGSPSDGFTVIEISYSIGLVLGIILFFNRIGKKRMSLDPTPLEVEMRLYEVDLQTAIVEDFARNGEEIDVGN